MRALVPQDRPLRCSIREIAIAAVSPLEARHLADALPAALERALARLRSGAPSVVPIRPRTADQVAAQIVRSIAEKLETAR